MLFIVVIIVQNHNAFSTAVNFRVDIPLIHAETSEISVYSIVTIAFLFGVLITGLYGIFDRYRMMKEIRMLKKKANEKDSELNSLRNLPITSDEITQPTVPESNDVT
jgi:ATP adenylyltransferase